MGLQSVLPLQIWFCAPFWLLFMAYANPINVMGCHTSLIQILCDFWCKALSVELKYCTWQINSPLLRREKDSIWFSLDFWILNFHDYSFECTNCERMDDDVVNVTCTILHDPNAIAIGMHYKIVILEESDCFRCDSDAKVICLIGIQAFLCWSEIDDDNVKYVWMWMNNGREWQ